MALPVVEYSRPGDLLSYTVGATPVVAGNLVELSGSRLVIPAQADSTKVVGIAVFDGATGDMISVMGGAAIVPMVNSAGGTVTAGTKVVADAAGTFKGVEAYTGTYVAAEMTISQRIIGMAIEDILANATGRVMLDVV